MLHLMSVRIMLAEFDTFAQHMHQHSVSCFQSLSTTWFQARTCCGHSSSGLPPLLQAQTQHPESTDLRAATSARLDELGAELRRRMDASGATSGRPVRGSGSPAVLRCSAYADCCLDLELVHLTCVPSG